MTPRARKPCGLRRGTRQNLERAFRTELKYETLQDRQNLGKYDKFLTDCKK